MFSSWGVLAAGIIGVGIFPIKVIYVIYVVFVVVMPMAMVYFTRYAHALYC